MVIMQRNIRPYRSIVVMMASTNTCCICLIETDSEYSVGIFVVAGAQQHWAACIGVLLQVPVSPNVLYTYLLLSAAAVEVNCCHWRRSCSDCPGELPEASGKLVGRQEMPEGL